MKLSKLLKFVVGALGIVAFIMMFMDQLSIEIFGQKGTGKFDEILFGTESSEGAIIGFIGYLLLLVGGVLVLFTAVSKSRFSNFICIISGVAMLLGSIFVFSIKGAYLDANSMNAAKDYIKLTFAPVLAGVLGILGCVGAAGAAVLDIKSGK